MPIKVSTNPRDYTFHAGKLEGRKVSEISDTELKWALDYNHRYITAHETPEAKVNYQGKRVASWRLPDNVRSRRVSLALEAIAACEWEIKYRESQKAEEQERRDAVAAAEKLVAAAAAQPKPNNTPEQRMVFHLRAEIRALEEVRDRQAAELNVHINMLRQALKAAEERQ